MRKFVFFDIAILVLIFSSFAVSRSFAQARPSDFEEIDAYISTRMEELGIPGAALVIVQGNQIVHMQGFGVADGNGRPVTPQTPFFTGSTGKSFTALAVMQLVEAGKVRLGAPVQSYLPWFRVADPTASEIITIRQLLNQNSGLPVAIGREQLAITGLSESAIENNVRALATVELIAPPGEQYEYSNANYVTLGMVIQAVSGQSYEAYIREHIYLPLDMQNSFTSKTEAQQAGLAVGYQKWFGVAVPSPDPPFSRGSIPAGQLAMSAEDFGHYLIAQLNSGNYGGVSVLSPEGISALHHPDVPIPGSPDYYAMGWKVHHFQDVAVISHNGEVPGYTTEMFLVPEKEIAVAMVMNTYSPMFGVRISRVPSNVLRLLLGQETISGFEFLSMRIIYLVVMSIPVLYLTAVVKTLRRLRFQNRRRHNSMGIHIGRYIALPLVWNGVLAYVLLVILPKSFEADIPTVILFQPDVGWVALVNGIFALVWGVISTGIGISMLHQTIKRPKIV
jgi:CubicO group peptidase (beta-lactamase class C family)